MYKLSRYLVTQAIKDFNDNTEKVILFSSRSTAIKIIDKTTYRNLRENKLSLIDKNLIKIMNRDHLLVDAHEDERQQVLLENKAHIQESRDLYIVIQPTAFCPFGCHYCGQLHTTTPMSDKTQKQTLLRVIKKLASKKYDRLTISWFGAEPLSGLSVIRKLSNKLQSVAKSFDVKYSAKIVTNGLLLTLPVARDLVDNHNIKQIEITLDGVAEFHDARRHTKAGRPTFDRIYENLLNICNDDDLQTKISIRCNVDDRNKDGISPLIQQLARDNLQKKISLYFAQIHSWGNDAHTLAADKKKFSIWEMDWFIEMEFYGFNVSYIHSRKKQVCMAINPKSELIDPHGNIFGCTEVSLVPSYENNGINIHQLGHVNKNSNDLQPSKFLDFYDTDEIKKFSCHECEILPMCGGSCPKEWKEGRIPCPSIKFNINERLVVYYAKSIEKQKSLQFFKNVA